MEQFGDHALGRPYHAALVDLTGRSHPHGHRDYYELMAVVHGDGEHVLSSGNGPTRTDPLRAGDVVLIRPRDRHTIIGPVRFYNIAFPATTWRTFEGLATIDPAADSFSTPPRQRLPAGDERAVRACAAVLDQFHHTPSALDLIRFWTDIVPLFPAPADRSPRPSGPPAWLVGASSAMSREEYLREGVPRLLALSHVSPAHLTRSMRRFYDTTPTAFVTDLRLRHAARLLATTTRTVTDIAYSCGFASPSYFTRCFRAAHRASPREFRQASGRAFVPS